MLKIWTLVLLIIEELLYLKSYIIILKTPNTKEKLSINFLKKKFEFTWTRPKSPLRRIFGKMILVIFSKNISQNGLVFKTPNKRVTLIYPLKKLKKNYDISIVLFKKRTC